MKLPWNRTEPMPPPPAATFVTATPDTTPQLEARVRALEDRLAHIVADAGLLRVEWSEVLDKISHWASRQAGRDRKAVNRSLEKLAEDAPGPTISAEPAPTTKAELRRVLASRSGRNGG